MVEMKIRDIIRDDFLIEGDPDRHISGVVFDSRRIRGGEVFVSIKGENFDGNDFIPDAIKKGAAAVVYKRGSLSQDFINSFRETVWIGVDEPRYALAAISSSFYKRPSDDLTVIGITGTNGKTTTSYLIKKILEKYGGVVGLIGTIGYLIKDRSYEANHTTPEASDYQSLLRQMADSGCDYVVSEVSSHSLSQKRVDFTKFRVAVFTNLTREHLDFHVTMEDYFKAKKRLFSELLLDNGCAAINLDDYYGQRLANELRDRDIRIITFGIKNSGATLRAENIKIGIRGISFDVKIDSGVFDESRYPDSFHISSSLVGMPNIYNILAAISVALSLNIPVDVVREALSEDLIIKGRFEIVDSCQDFLAVIDYAHSEDAIERLLLTVRQLLDSSNSKNKKIITVFGCGGNRDRGKRPVMGEIASRLSDFVIITSDNPRNEEPREIIRDIEGGIRDRDNYIIIPDREMAIKMAVLKASRGDVVVVAGKGHEDYQEIKGKRYNFSDRIVIEDAVAIKKKNRVAMKRDA